MIHQRPMPKPGLALGALGLLAACTTNVASSDSFPSTVMSDHGRIEIELSTSPQQPPLAGNDSVRLALSDPKTGKPIEGEQISLVPFMPTMGHGTDVVPQLQELGRGLYLFTNVNLFMPGEWQLRFQFAGPVSDSASPDIPDVR